MRGRRVSIFGVSMAMVLAGCGDPSASRSPLPSPSPSGSPAPPASDGWTARAVGGLAGANPYGLQIVPSTAGTLVIGTMVATVGSTKGEQNNGRDAAYHWRCPESSCRLVPGSVRPTDHLDPATTGLTAVSASPGTVQVTRCTEAGCEAAPTPHATMYAGPAAALYGDGSDLAAFAADGEHLVVLSGSKTPDLNNTAVVRSRRAPVAPAPRRRSRWPP